MCQDSVSDIERQPVIERTFCEEKAELNFGFAEQEGIADFSIERDC